MTAEVAILNRIGVALAADSVATIRGGEGEKTYSSEDKIFRLSHSVGVMTYGNAGLLDVPWETVVEEYRRELGERAFPTVKKYAEDFLRFINRNKVLFPKKIRDEGVLDLLRESYCFIKIEIEEEFESKEENSTSKETARIIEDVVDRLSEDVRKSRPFEGVTGAAVSAIRRKFAKDIRKMQEDVFDDLPVSTTISKKIQSIGIQMLRKSYFIEEYAAGAFISGVVFAGFGSQEPMPAIRAYKTHGMVGDKLRTIGEHDVTALDHWGIFPFAQMDDIHLFVKGIHPEHVAHMRASTHHFLDDIITSVLNAIQKDGLMLSGAAEQKIHSRAEKSIKKLFDDWDSKATDYGEPIIDIVEFLPKYELAPMAETLVNLVKFRAKVTPALETVGGPIDVALITRGDGFVWVKRKSHSSHR